MSVEGDVLRVAAAPGEADLLTVAPSLTSASLMVSDGAAPLVAGPGCSVGADESASCSPPVGNDQFAGMEVDAGDFDDSVSVSASIPATLLGGDGDDRITGGSGDDACSAVPAPTSRTVAGATTRSTCGTVARTAFGAAAGSTAYLPRRTTARPGVRERRLRTARPGGPHHAGDRRRAIRATPRPDLGARGPAHPRRRALPGPPLPRAHHGGLRNGRPRALRRAPARSGGRHRARSGRHLGRRVAPRALGRAAPVPPRFPFRWVGWNGDFNHGHPSVCRPSRGCAPHLHLSWSHSPGTPRRPVRTAWVFAVR